MAWMAPGWLDHGTQAALRLGEALLILAGAWLLNALLRRLLVRLCARYEVAPA